MAMVTADGGVSWQTGWTRPARRIDRVAFITPQIQWTRGTWLGLPFAIGVFEMSYDGGASWTSVTASEYGLSNDSAFAAHRSGFGLVTSSRGALVTWNHGRLP